MCNFTGVSRFKVVIAFRSFEGYVIVGRLYLQTDTPATDRQLAVSELDIAVLQNTVIKLVNRLRQPRRIIRLLTLLHRLVSVSPLSPRLFGVAGLQHAFTGLRAQNSRRRIVAAKAFGIDDRVLICTRDKLAMSIAKAKVRLLHIVCDLVDRCYARQNAARPNAQSSAQLVARGCTDRMTQKALCGDNRPILDAPLYIVALVSHYLTN